MLAAAELTALLVDFVSGSDNPQRLEKTMSVRAKFYVASVTDCDYGPGKVVKLSAFADSEKTNESWSKWTPSGELRMHITNEAAYEQFAPGKNFFLDFTPAE